MDVNKKRWIVLVACCVINLCLGSIYAWSVFSSSMAEYLSMKTSTTITSQDLAMVYTLANAVGPVTMISGGWFNDRFGPKKVLLIGTSMYGLGLILSGFVQSVSMLMLTYGLIGGLGLGMAYGCTISTAVKYFPDKRGLIGGVATAVYGLSSVIVSPLVVCIVQKSDAPTAFKIIGASFLALMVICSLFVSGRKDENSNESEEKADIVDLDYKGMLKEPIFYVMILLLMCGAFSGMMIVSQASGLAQNMVGMSAMSASTAVSVLALFNASGRILAGYISDRMGRVFTLRLALLCSIVGVTILYFTQNENVLKFYLGVSLVGLSFGGFMGVYPGFTADQFGAKHSSVNYGIMFIGFAAAGFFGPMVMKSVPSYSIAFLVAFALCIVGLILCQIYNKMSRKVG